MELDRMVMAALNFQNNLTPAFDEPEDEADEDIPEPPYQNGEDEDEVGNPRTIDDE